MTAALALTMGEPAGIGGEIALRAWLARQEHGLPPFFVLDDVDQFVDELLDFGATEEPDDVGGDFVGDADGEDGRMIAAGLGGFANGIVGLLGEVSIADESEVFGPGDVEEDL